MGKKVAKTAKGNNNCKINLVGILQRLKIKNKNSDKYFINTFLYMCAL